MHEVAKIFKIKKRAIYGNQRDKGHYDVNPYSYVPKKDVKLKNKKYYKPQTWYLEIIKEIKKKNEKERKYFCCME